MSEIEPSKLRIFFSKRHVKIIGISLSVIIASASVAGVSYGIYYAVFSEKQENIAPFDWSNFSTEWRAFSTANSYRVQLVTARNDNSVSISSGTAWSWYQHEVTNNTFQWYLMTNFHVVNDALYFNDNSSKDFFRKKKMTINEGFALQTYNSDYGDYQDIVTKNKDWRDESNQTNKAIANFPPSQVEVIFDYNDNYKDRFDQLELFSNSSPSLSDNTRFYNLDMALIRISYTWSHYMQFKSYFQQIANPYNMYLNGLIDRPLKNDIETYLAGNPSKSKQIVASAFNSDFYIFNGRLNINTSTYPDTLLKELKAPYYYANIGYNDWKLGPGASGSAIYQGQNIAQNTNPIGLLPIGIYWGVSFETESQKSHPSFIPLIFEQPNNVPDNTKVNSLSYNIFENFRIFLTTKYAT